jgi:hypothetical protein
MLYPEGLFRSLHYQEMERVAMVKELFGRIKKAGALGLEDNHVSSRG